MVFVVIDKSWLEAVGKQKLCDVTKDHRLLLPAALGYELFTTRESSLMSSFRKLISVQQSTDLIDHVGSFLRFESENQLPCTPIENQRYHIQFEFNTKLTEPDFLFTEDQKQSVEEFRDHWEISGVDRFKEVSAGVSLWFPELRKIKAGSSMEDVLPVMNKIASDAEQIKQIYDKCRRDFFPPTKVINENWAHFRWLQIRLLAGVEYIRKYGAGNTDAVSKDLPHDNLDLQYCVTGILAQALATDDKQIKFYFDLCCPNGLLLTNLLE